MVKLTGDFHSVYHRTKDSLDDINRIMKSTIGDQITSVLQKPNYLELKLRNNLNFKQQAQLKKLVDKKYNLSKVWKDSNCNHKINLWYKKNNRVGDRKAVLAHHVLDKGMKIFLPENIKSKEGNYPDLGFACLNDPYGYPSSTEKPEVHWVGRPAIQEYITENIEEADVIWVSMGTPTVGTIQRQYGKYDDKVGQKIPASALNSYESLLKGTWKSKADETITQGILGRIDEQPFDVNEQDPNDAILRYGNAYIVGHFQELGFPICDSDGDYEYRSGYSSVDEKHMDWYPRNLAKYPTKEDTVMITFDTQDPMAKIALSSKDMLIKLHNAIGTKYGDKGESIRFGYNWFEGWQGHDDETGQHAWAYSRARPDMNDKKVRPRMRFYLRNNTGLSQMERAQELLGKKWEIEECNAGGCCKDTEWCLVVNRK